jgi:hypothetical protein
MPQLGVNRIGDAIGGFRIRRFDNPVLPRFRRGDRALIIEVVRCRCQTLISSAIAYNFKNGCQYLGVQTRRFVDVEVVDVTVAAQLLTSMLDSEPWKPAPRDM